MTSDRAILSDQGFFANAAAAQLNAALGVNQTLVGDNLTPTGTGTGIGHISSGPSGPASTAGELSTDTSSADLSGMMAKDLVMSNELVDKTALLDK